MRLGFIYAGSSASRCPRDCYHLLPNSIQVCTKLCTKFPLLEELGGGKNRGQYFCLMQCHFTARNTVSRARFWCTMTLSRATLSPHQDRLLGLRVWRANAVSHAVLTVGR